MSRSTFLRRIIIALATATSLVVPAVATALPADAAGTVRSAVSLTAPASAAYGSHIALTGTLWRYGTSTRIAGARVYLQRATHGRTNWTSVTSTTTSSTGTLRFAVGQGIPYDYRAYYAGSPTYTTAVSPVRYPIVTQKVFLHAMKDAEPFGGILTASGVRYPAFPSGGPVYLQRYDTANKTWKNIGFSRTRADGRFDIEAIVGGSVARYRVYAPANAGYGAGVSAERWFTHYAMRGVFRKPVLGTGGTYNPFVDVLSATEDPKRSTAVAFADDNGTAWVDVNVSGCKLLIYSARNGSDGDVRVSVLDDGTELEGTTLGPGGEIVQPTGPALDGQTKVRLQAADISSTRPYAVIRAEAKCPN